MGDAGDGMPFIGSQISLISKSGIRYEGVLHTINMEESSIALQSGTRLQPPGAQQAGQGSQPGAWLTPSPCRWPPAARSALLRHRRQEGKWSSGAPQQRNLRVHHLQG